ncbi:hypothetical protein RCL_jg15311.t1 [Rhizophagus clarus]|uniref:Uncharacterized protein n=1 Tax=Rhizophagus clarus TaxID=94130 RepID=A0A8H3KRA9_9GLOM|nr:hypothetical protein RCL_jg15311.t1 [Rhizophagus clarus]
MKENIAFMVFLFMKWVETYFAHEITWAEEKRNQLAYRLNWITFERARKLLQEGYVLLSDGLSEKNCWDKLIRISILHCLETGGIETKHSQNVLEKLI